MILTGFYSTFSSTVVRRFSPDRGLPLSRGCSTISVVQSAVLSPRFRPSKERFRSWPDNFVSYVFCQFVTGDFLIDLGAVYSIITELPAVFLLYDSAFWSSAYILLLFAVSVWNGGGFYIEVFGRK